MSHPRTGDRQRPTPATTLTVQAIQAIQAQVELTLPRGQLLPGRGLEHLELGVGVRRPDMGDLPRTPPGAVHDLHHPGA
ncbi:MAG: hypothetical protein U0Q19_10050 [Kineosporiaceae bacterium]